MSITNVQSLLILVVSMPFIPVKLLSQPYGLEERVTVPRYFHGVLPRQIPEVGDFIVEPAFPELVFEDPVGLVPQPRSNRLHVYTRQGRVFSFENDRETNQRTLFLDLSAQTQGWDDCGFMGMAFHPEFGIPESPNRGYFYVFYQYTNSPIGHRFLPPKDIDAFAVTFNRLSRFTVPDGAATADPDSELILIDQRDEHIWHNGGGMFFHPTDGFLYLSLGDEGHENSSFQNDQRIDKDLFSGIIRIDVDMDPQRSHAIRHHPVDGQSFTGNYFIPNDNPFLDPEGKTLEEFWCLGFREPHRITCDPITGTIWAGDVGQGGREEVNLVVRGGNYQWAYREGSRPGFREKPEPLVGIDSPPVHEYNHNFDGDNCVIGGYVYRGSEHAEKLGGKYIFGDNGSGKIWALDLDEAGQPILDADGKEIVNEIARMPAGSSGQNGLSGFGVDHESRLYLCRVGEFGAIYKLSVPPPPTEDEIPPATLSEIGLFTDLAELTPAPGLIPYTVNSELWSDNAVKTRWMALGGRIVFDPVGEWSFGSGTVFVKHFDLPVDENDPNLMRRLETRLLVKDAAGGAYGLTYKWREDNSDADLLPGSLEEDIEIRTATGTKMQRWYYPSRQDCIRCHTPAAGFVLGLRTQQLNGEFLYPQTGVTDNQLRTLNHLVFLSPSLDEAAIPDFEKFAAIDDETATLWDRVRSYLAANCAHCHRPGGVRGTFDARYENATLRGLINGSVAQSLGIEDALVISPGSLAKSILYHRINRVGEKQMPPLARGVIHEPAVKVFSHWVQSLPPSAEVRGVLGEYFGDLELTDFKHAQTEARIDYNWGLEPPGPLGIGVDNFSVRWTAKVIPGFSEPYTFYTTSDDGVRLWVDDQLIIDNWTDHGVTVDQGAPIALEADQQYRIKMEYYEKGLHAVARLEWSSPSLQRQIIPSARLRSLSPSVPELIAPFIFEVKQHDGHAQFRVNAEQVGTYEVQSSTDLLSWESRDLFEGVRGVFEFRDAQPANPTSKRFYRVLIR